MKLAFTILGSKKFMTCIRRNQMLKTFDIKHKTQAASWKNLLDTKKSRPFVSPQEKQSPVFPSMLYIYFHPCPSDSVKKKKNVHAGLSWEDKVQKIKMKQTGRQPKRHKKMPLLNIIETLPVFPCPACMGSVGAVEKG